MRHVKAGLGGDADGVSGDDEGVKRASIPISKGVDWHCRIAQHSEVLQEPMMKTAMLSKHSSTFLACYDAFLMVVELSSCLSVVENDNFCVLVMTIFCFLLESQSEK